MSERPTVEELRELHRKFYHPDSAGISQAGMHALVAQIPALADAIDELERLRRENEHLREDCGRAASLLSRVASWKPLPEQTTEEEIQYFIASLEVSAEEATPDE